MGWERSTLRITGRDTAHTERFVMRLVDTLHLSTAVCIIQGKECFARHPSIEFILSSCLCQCCTHDSSFLLSPYFAHNVGQHSQHAVNFSKSTWYQIKIRENKVLREV